LHILYQIFDWEYFLWAVVWGLYGYDCIRKVDKGRFLIVLSRRSLHAKFSESNFCRARKIFYFSEFLRPSRLVFEEDWIRPNLSARPLSSQSRYLKTLSQVAEPFRVLSLVQGWILLVYGPILTFSHNLNLALTTVLVGAYANSAIMAILLRNSPFWKRLSQKHHRQIISDLFLCVPYGINVAGRISMGLSLPFSLFPHLLFPAPSEETKAVLRQMVDEMQNSYDFEDGSELIEKLRALGESKYVS
jgi:hypothetical protein